MSRFRYFNEYLDQYLGLTNVYVIRDGSRLEPGYREDRVRVVVETNGYVIEMPRAG